MKTVYFIRPVGMIGPVKIGCSIMPHHRLAMLAEWSPFDLEIVAVIKGGGAELERRLHGIFSASYLRREWFAETPELTALIAALSAGRPIEDLIDMSAPVTKLPRRPGADYSPERRRYLSYSSRLRHAFLRLRREDLRGDWRQPPDVVEIIARWSGYGMGRAVQPSPSELRRLDEVLANPRKHATTWRKAPAPRRPRRKEAA